ncbi:MAG TPA: aspartyl/asparaginyl beta-hydroxylase domain-containing protein [Gammaproteobacteria bacterium]|nr:aspartyl/asparaginyl beta-hydroxylase domain-containing protein [Gammaproteobacteria bacterium]
MSPAIGQLVEQATRLASSGRWDDAERIWLEIRTREPRHAQALFSLGVHALRRGDGGAARELLVAARAEAPNDRLVLMTLCAAQRHLGDAAAEREAIEAALTLDPYFLPALLAKSSWFERYGTAASAAAMFSNALKVAPSPHDWPAALRADLEHAREVVASHRDALDMHLERELGALLRGLPAASVARWREAQSVVAGKSQPYNSQSNQLHVPRLPAIPFFDRTQFPFLDALEAKTAVIRAELEAALEAAREEFVPYIQYAPGQPVNQWQELNHSLRWSTLHLWRNGKPVEDNLARCPETARALAALPLADIGELCPNAMFSALAPKSRIPPHNGETNARVIAHLPLIVPQGCSYRVGFDWRQWRVGETLIFDDTIEHEARNDSDELRVVLIFDLWNPLLTPAERELVRRLAQAARTFGSAPA